MNEPNIAALIANQPFYERAIAAVAPSWGLTRLQNKVSRTLFEYQAAQSNRLFAPKTWGTPAESSKTVRERKVMMWEARDLIENYPDTFTVLGKFSNNCAPTEYTPATGDAKYDALVADYFHEWCKRADVTGRHSFRKLMQLALEMRPVDGDCGFAIRRTRDGLRLDLIPADRIGNPNEVVMAENYTDGITVDGAGAPVSYRVFRLTKEGQYTDPEDISVQFFQHYFDPFRSDQYRGVSAFHAVIQTARMAKGIRDAEMVGVKFASQQAALVFNERGSAPTRNLFQPTNGTLPTGQPRQDEYTDIGQIKYMATGDRVEIMPSRPGSAFAGFMDDLKAAIADGLDIPKGVLYGTSGYKGPNVRAEFAQADRVWDRHRGILADKVLDPIKEKVLLSAIANGELPMPPKKEGENVTQTLRRAIRGEWRWPAKMSIDAGRDSAANLNEHRQGILSGQQIAAEQGYDYWATLEQKASEAAKIQELAKSYGVPETAIALTTSSLPSTPAAAAAAGDNVAASAAQAQADSVPSQGQSPALSRKFEVDLQPTAEMAAEAKRGLAWRDEHNRGGTAVGVARARDISNRANLSPDTVARMVSYFARHEIDKQGQGWAEGSEGYPSAGRIAWALWGGDAGRAWAERKQDEMEREDGELSATEGTTVAELLNPRAIRSARAARLSARVARTASIRSRMGEISANSDRINAAFQKLSK